MKPCADISREMGSLPVPLGNVIGSGSNPSEAVNPGLVGHKPIFQGFNYQAIPVRGHGRARWNSVETELVDRAKDSIFAASKDSTKCAVDANSRGYT